MTKLLARFASKHLYVAFLHVAIVVLAMEVYVLAEQNRQFKNVSERAYRTRLAEYDSLSFANLQPIDSGSQKISESRGAIVFIMTTRCPFCRRNIASWKTLSSVARSNGLETIGISLDSIETTSIFVKQEGIDFAVWIPRHIAKYSEENKLVGVPITVLRDSTGIAQRVWNGLLADSVVGEIIHTITNNKMFIKKGKKT
jgi:peroxiredoxin